MIGALCWLVPVALLAACTSPGYPTDPAAPPTAAAPASASAPASAAASAPVAAPAPASASAAAPAPAAPAAPAISASDAEHILFPHASPGWTVRDCPAQGADADRIRCMIGLRYPDDEAARALALRLYDAAGSVAGVERELVMDGGFRGKLRLVPEPPVGRYRKHLDWVVAASADFDSFFQGLAPHAKAPITYRHRTLAWKFFRSVGRTTPSAYAEGWSIGYNVSGSLHGSADAVRDTLFHEIFHLNDGARRWSRLTIGTLYDGIVARCGTKVQCLTPYAPTQTKVRGGTYYAFQPDNGDGVHEYAAEIATRYYREHRALLRGERLASPAFKCGPEENARAWSAVVTEFFGGADLVPPC